MPDEQYIKALENAVYALHEAENQLFTAMVNVGFSGVYRDISKLHEPGESINLELAMFEETGDENLDYLVDCINQLNAIKLTLISENKLEVDLEEDDENSTDEEQL